MGTSTNAAAASRKLLIHRFSAGRPHTPNANRPPGATHLAMLPKAVAGSAKNITPNRETIRS